MSALNQRERRQAENISIVIPSTYVKELVPKGATHPNIWEEWEFFVCRMYTTLSLCYDSEKIRQQLANPSQFLRFDIQFAILLYLSILTTISDKTGLMIDQGRIWNRTPTTAIGWARRWAAAYVARTGRREQHESFAPLKHVLISYRCEQRLLKLYRCPWSVWSLNRRVRICICIRVCAYVYVQCVQRWILRGIE